MRFNSIRFKASILYSAILAVILIVFSGIIYFSVDKILYQNLDHELRIKAEEISGILNAYEKIKLSEEFPLNRILEIMKHQETGMSQKLIIDDLWRSQIKVLNLEHDFINLIDLQGRITMHSNNFSEPLARLFREQIPLSKANVIYKTVHKTPFKLRAISLPVNFQGINLIVQVGTSPEKIDALLEKVLWFMISTVIVLLILTSFVGRIFSDNVLNPVKEVSDLANSITYKKLSERIKENRFDHEMEYLVKSFNGLINRLETSFSHINEFSSHTAHELKTPLAIIRGEIELALDGTKESAEYKKILRDCLEEIDRMIKVIKDLLILAKFDYKPEIFHFTDINMNTFLNELYEQSRILTEEKQIAVIYKGLKSEVVISADSVHLRRLFHNIISNAIKYTSMHGTIELISTIKDKKVFIDIKDSGRGIATENLNKIFDKFYRIYQENEETEIGNGLGLSIALSIAKAHHGNILADSKIGEGSTFTVILPIV